MYYPKSAQCDRVPATESILYLSTHEGVRTHPEPLTLFHDTHRKREWFAHHRRIWMRPWDLHLGKRATLVDRQGIP